MKPSDLYERTPESIDYNIGTLIGCYYCHIPELRDHEYGFPYADLQKRVEIRVMQHVNWDFRRYWRLATVWFDSEPVMVIQNAGREGDDHAQRFVTHEATYRAMISYLLSLVDFTPTSLCDVVGVDDEIQGLDHFYSHQLGDQPAY